jgi:hypothetical protein
MAAAGTTTMKYAWNEQKRGRLEYSYVQIDINGKEEYGEEVKSVTVSALW